jgi:hypothetical protein
MKDSLNFITELFKSRTTSWLLAVYGLWAFSTTVVDQFFPSSSAKLKTIYLLPKWHWYTWVITGFGLVIVVLFDGAYKIWTEKEKVAAAATSNSPQVILDFEPLLGDMPRKRKRCLTVRNIGPATAVNVRLEPFIVGDATVECDPVNRLLPNTDTARLTAEVRRKGSVLKPVLLELELLFESVFGREIADADTATVLVVTYEDLAGRKYRVEYSVKYRPGINECQTEFKTLDLIG